MSSHQASKAGAGLRNLGNTCFANSVLQCLTHTAQFADNILRHDHIKNCCVSGEFCMMCAMESHVKLALNNTGKVLSPDPIIRNLPNIAEHFELGQQQDANEFFQYAVNKLRQSTETDIRLQKTENPKINKKWIDDIFVGSLRSRIVCQKCHHKSNNYEEFIDIPLDINTSNTVEEALNKFVEAETLHGDNAYKCSVCDTFVKAKKQCKIHRAPEVLTLSLQRYNIFTGSKQTKKVKYPKRFKIAKYTSYDNDDTYKLYGVLVHIGSSLQSGHYQAYVKASDHRWYLMNDSRVRPCAIQTALDQEAYILFYKRIPNKSKTNSGHNQGKESINPKKKIETNSNGDKKRKLDEDSSMDHRPKKSKTDSSSVKPELSRKIILKKKQDTNTSTNKILNHGENYKRKADQDSSMEPITKKRKTESNSSFQHQEKKNGSDRVRDN